MLKTSSRTAHVCWGGSAYGETRFAQGETGNSPRGKSVKIQVLFLKILSSPGAFLIFLQWPNNYLVSPSAGEQVWWIFSMYLHFSNVNIYVSINDYLFKYIYLVCDLNFHFYCLTCSEMPNFNSVDFTIPNSHQRF